MFHDIYQSYINNKSLEVYQKDRLDEFYNHIPIIDRKDELKIFSDLREFLPLKIFELAELSLQFPFCSISPVDAAV